MTIPVVAVVGRPNVGKSTLVNRILGRRDAIVQERPGVTRDRVLYTADWNGRSFVLVDSGGLETRPEGELARKVADAARLAASESDVVVFVTDVTQGVTPEDLEVASEIRRVAARVIVAANKSDNLDRETAAAEFFELGLGDTVPISALHGRGIGTLLDEVTRDFAAQDLDESDEPAVAIVGRPNVGKSSLFNRLVGSERSIVHDEPGTTRDAVDTVLEVEGERYRFVDTAGLRRASHVDDSTEYYGVVRTMRALEQCDVALVVIDATEGIARQDLRICERVAELGRSAILVGNKIDLLEPRDLKVEREEIRRRLPYMDFAPLIETSAVTGRGVEEVMPAVRRILDGRGVRIPTPVLNAAIDDLQARTPIPSQRHVRVKYGVQAEVAPPTIALFGANRIPEQWLRYLERGLRARFGFEGTPIHFSLRGAAPRRGSAQRRPGQGSRSASRKGDER